MIILEQLDPVGKAEGTGDFQPVLFFILAVTAFALGLDKTRLGQGRLPCQFLHIVDDAVCIKVFTGLEAAARLLQAQTEAYPGIGHGLTAQAVVKILGRDIDVRKHIQIRQPADDRACFPPVRRALFQLFAFFADGIAAFKAQVITEAVAAYRHVHIA